MSPEVKDSLYYCEVCFAVPLRQSFSYTYQPKPWQPQAPKLRKKSAKKTAAELVNPELDDTSEAQCANSQPVYPQLGQRVFASFGRSRKEGWIISASQQQPQSLQQALAEGKLLLGDLKELEIAEPQPIFGPQELRLAHWLAQYYICSLGEALNCILPTGKKEKEPLLYEAVNLDKGAKGSIESMKGRDLLAPPAQLSEEQRAAIATLCGDQEFGAELSPKSGQELGQEIKQKPKQSPFYYLFGPTGSGKTEVFLQCMAQVLARGKSVIYLVPEISLCYQLQEQLRSRFQQPVALLHSHLSPEMRLWYWKSLQQGDCRIVLGARSAVFAPVCNLGMVILDEEHEQSYKAGDTPRYHARQVAMRRCRDSKAILLMGSATPSVEAMHSSNYLTDQATPANSADLAKQRLVAPKSLELLRLSERLAGGSFPEVQIIDLRSSKTMISEKLQREIELVTSRGDQAILFLNRRGYSPIVECFSCGKVQECRHCSVALTYHKNLQRLKCHHCGFSMPMISSCNYCHQTQLEFVGFGTQQIEEELQRYFSHLRIARLDTDVSRKKGQSQKILQEFRDGQLDLLVGTQMVAKGLNFERVKLVGVVLADTSLNMPDFRAAERSFSLLVQVAGRAGRFSKDGKVLIQTYQPQSEVVAWAAALDWQNFYARELELRQMTHYPPFSRIIRLVFRGSDMAKVKAEAQQWYGHLQPSVAELVALGTELTGALDFAEIFAPCECPYFRVANKYRYHMLLRCSQRHFGALHSFVQQYFWQAQRSSNVYIEIDVDPSAMM